MVFASLAVLHKAELDYLLVQGYDFASWASQVLGNATRELEVGNISDLDALTCTFKVMGL